MKTAILILAFLWSLNAVAAVEVTCWNSSCLKNGWLWTDTATKSFKQYGCYRDGCDKSGWIVSGTARESYTQCKGKGCFNEGWYDLDANTQELRKEIVCRGNDTQTETDCMKFGWVNYSRQNGQEAVITCYQTDCANKGWLVQQITGQMIHVRCKPGGCFVNGWTEN